MRTTSLLLAALAGSVSLRAQTTEIPAPTVPMATVTLASLAPAPITSAQLASLSTVDGRQTVKAVTLVPNGAVNGFYNVNATLPPTPPSTTPNNRRALALNTSGQMVVLDAFTSYRAFDLVVDLDHAGQEFGLEVGDWIDRMIVEFRHDGRTVGSLLTSRFETGAVKFFRSQAFFDQVVVRTELPTGNWVAPAFSVPVGVAGFPFGSGCAGSNGTPSIRQVSPATIGITLGLELANLPLNAGFLLVSTGFSSTNSAFGPLPLDLSGFGMPNCVLRCEAGRVAFLTHSGGSFVYTIAIPNAPALLGTKVYNQGYIADAGANPLGFTTTPGHQGYVIPQPPGP